MEAKPRSILALLMSSVMVCMVTLLVTFLDLGLRSDFLLQWTKAYFIAWPIAATTVLHHAAGAPPDRSHRRPDRRQALTLRVLGVFRNCVARGGDRASRNRAIARAAG
jgi:hypothetical protein